MDPASIISFIGFGVQVVDGILKLKGFLDDVQDAPDYIRKLQSELDLLLRSIQIFHRVDEARRIPVPEDVQTLVVEASEKVQEQIEDIIELLQKLFPSGRIGGPRKLWNKVNVVLRKDKVTKLIGELERAEKTLETAQRAMERAMITQQTGILSSLSAKASLMENSMSHLTIAEERRLDMSQQIISVIHANAQYTKTLEDSVDTAHKKIGSVENEMAQLRMVTETILASLGNIGDMKSRILEPYLQQVARDMIMSRHEGRFLDSVDQPHQNTDTSGSTYLETGKQETLKWTSPTTTGFDRMRVTRSNKVTTIYHNPLIGTVSVRRKASTSKTLHSTSSKFDVESEESRTFIHLRLASWISDKSYNVIFEQISPLYSAPRLGITLEAVRYIDMPSSALDAVRAGDLGRLQETISQRRFSPKDRCNFSGTTLFDISLVALCMEWVHEDSNTLPSRTPHIVTTALWLLSQGLETKENEASEILRSSLFLSIDRDLVDRDTQIRNMERLLLGCTANSPPVGRARLLVLFAVVNPHHSNDLDVAIWDLVNEGATEDDVGPLQHAADTFWCTSEDHLGYGTESVILLSMLRVSLSRTSDRSTILKALEGPRRLVLELLRQAIPLGERDNFIQYSASILRICRPLAILEDGFSQFVYTAAFGNQTLDIWRCVLRLASYSADLESLERRFSIEHQWLDRPLDMARSTKDNCLALQLQQAKPKSQPDGKVSETRCADMSNWSLHPQQGVAINEAISYFTQSETPQAELNSAAPASNSSMLLRLAKQSISFITSIAV
ncbi:hypothetical protein MMC18_006224 [Xylographa bjoerkii]|nr:hypothetical protein [Xylographa bjoerkii]